MKYWTVHYNDFTKQYQLKGSDEINANVINPIAVFFTFDMAYAYISMLNGTNVQNVYSRWAVR